MLEQARVDNEHLSFVCFKSLKCMDHREITVSSQTTVSSGWLDVTSRFAIPDSSLVRNHNSAVRRNLSDSEDSKDIIERRERKEGFLECPERV